MVWLGEHRAFIAEEFIKNGRLPVATQRAFCIDFTSGRRDTVPFCSKYGDVKWHSVVDLKQPSVYFPEIKKHLPYLLWFLIY
jgi:hypothetical protein